MNWPRCCITRSTSCVYFRIRHWFTRLTERDQCAANRSAIACSLLAQAGRNNVTDLVGGIKAWIATKLPTQPENTLTCGTKICETVVSA